MNNSVMIFSRLPRTSRLPHYLVAQINSATLKRINPCDSRVFAGCFVLALVMSMMSSNVESQELHTSLCAQSLSQQTDNPDDRNWNTGNSVELPGMPPELMAGEGGGDEMKMSRADRRKMERDTKKSK